MNILLIGVGGQLGRSLNEIKLDNKHFNIFSPDSKALDLTNNQSIDKCMSEFKPNLIINCAAFTKVDDAEISKDEAFKVNSIAPGYIAKKADELNSFFIHISTDYVFGGEGNGPYKNTDNPSPLNYYGLTKYEGERNIINNTDNFLIIRTASLMSHYRGNFASLIIDNLLNSKKMNIIKNQYISATCCLYLTKYLKLICDYYLK